MAKYSMGRTGMSITSDVYNITTGFTIAGTGTTGIVLSAGLTTGINFSGAIATPISITGASTTGISLTGDTVTGINQTNTVTAGSYGIYSKNTVTGFAGSDYYGAYIRAQSDTNAATAKSLYGAMIYGCANAVTHTTGSLWGLFSYAYIKGDATVTIAKAYGAQVEFSMDAGRANTATITTEAAMALLKCTTGKMADYTKLHGLIIRLGDMDGGSRTYGNGILIEDDGDMGGTCGLTTGINLSAGCTTGINIAGASTTAIAFGTSAGKIVDAAASISMYGGGTTGDALVLQGSSADAGQSITITGATGTTILGNLILGASGSETVTFTAKLGSQLYHNITGASYTVLKIHNHDTTAEIGGVETKGDLVNNSGSVVGNQHSWTYEPTTTSGAPSGVSATSNVLAVSPGFTVTAGNIYALVGEAQLYGTLSGATVNVAGVIGVVGGNGANTQVLHMAGIQSAMSTGLVNPTTGTLSYFLANSLSTVVVDNLICSLQSQYITNFIYFDSSSGGCVTAETGATFSGDGVKIKILVEGSTYYLRACASFS